MMLKLSYWLAVLVLAMGLLTSCITGAGLEQCPGVT